MVIASDDAINVAAPAGGVGVTSVVTILTEEFQAGYDNGLKKEKEFLVFSALAITVAFPSADDAVAPPAPPVSVLRIERMAVDAVGPISVLDRAGDRQLLAVELPGRPAVALLAPPATVCGDAKVVTGQGVTVLAMGFSGVLSNRAIPPEGVLSNGDDL
jgi:hypothetical protein